jgi:hypothetical protein
VAEAPTRVARSRCADHATLLLPALAETRSNELRTSASFSAKTDVQRWDLPQLTVGAENLGLISETTAEQCEIAKDFRKLIHPGRTLRLSLRCDRIRLLLQRQQWNW